MDPNFDELVEAAAERLHIDVQRLIIYEDDRGHLLKVHGTLTGSQVLARSEDILETFPWPGARLRFDFNGAEVALAADACRHRALS